VAEFLIRRIAASLMMIFIVSFVIFALARLVPASPALLILGADAPDAQIRAFEIQHGLDRPVVAQYATWITNVVTKFDFGVSYVTGLPITQEITATLPLTLELLAVAMLMCLSIAIPFGVISALYRERFLDHLLRALAIIGISTPGFWIGLLLILWLSVHLRWFPPGDLTPLSAGIWAHFKSILLPALSLGIYYTAIISRMTRASVLEVLSQEYVRTAVALGLSKTRIRLSYVLRNALITIVSVVAMACGYMFGWAIVI
jgi:peptide/nickel transport system permease protein